MTRPDLQIYLCPKCDKTRQAHQPSTRRKPIRKPCVPCAAAYNRLAGRLDTFRRQALFYKAPLSLDRRYLTMRDWEEIARRATRCSKCSKACADPYPSAIVPFHAGGALRKENTRAICADCKKRST